MGRVIARTARLTLRCLTLSDAGFILELLNEPGFLRFIGDKGVRTLHDAREYLLGGPMLSYDRNGYGLYAVGLSDGTRVGICGLVKREGLDDTDVGFAFLARHCARGYATESAVAVLEHARRDLKIVRIVAITDPDNAGSIAVVEKVGLKFERMIRLNPQDIELNLYGLELLRSAT
jgi:RimJ/RimL family protein N-acetyltransferase